VRIRQQVLARLFRNPLGTSPVAIELDGDRIQVTRRGQPVSLPFEDIKGAPLHQRTWLGTTVRIPRLDGSEIVLHGTPNDEAAAFVDAIADRWADFHITALTSEGERIARILGVVESLTKAERYSAACLIEPALSDSKALHKAVLSKLHPDAIGAEAYGLVASVEQFIANAKTMRSSSIDKFVATQLEQWKDFFDTIESKPLTPEQRLAVVVDEDGTLVLAGAGSGKTSVITAKAAYLAKSGIRKPEEILLLAFAKNAAAEMSERVEARSGAPVAAQTFHALAYGIIGTVEGSKPALAEHTTDDNAFLNLIKDILKELVRRNPDISNAVIKWFAHFLVEPGSEWDFKTKHEFYSHLEKQDLRTLQGEKVKSYEELQIANWLYENGIEYEYEPLYEHKVSNEGRRDYSPDFRLTESGVYIEHFGVRRRQLPDGTDHLTTAPFVEREKYLAGMDWKRQVHETHGTTLIETYSYERQEGRLLTALAEKLEPHITLAPRAAEDIFDRIVGLNQVDTFSQLLGTFLRKFKGGGYTLEGCAKKSKKMKFGRRGDAFLSLFQPVFEEYQSRLTGRIDFEDMVLRAAAYVETGSYRSPYRHILVDEFQDISQGRAKLVRALKAQHSDCRIFAVGDDWQSIFRFAGSDIHIMRNFGQVFGGTFDGENGIHRTVDLGRTFRSVDQIAFAARTFVLKNPAQIQKQIVPAGTATEPALRILLTKKDDKTQKLHEALASLSGTPGVSDSPSVLILGRYRYLEPNMADLRHQHPGLRISFKTIHASKGLEADHVILLNADSGRGGFPSETVDDPLLTLVSPEEEAFEYAEERRVMYVAMTRARRTLTILASNSRPSSFITELQTEPGYALLPATEHKPEVHECGECGGRLLSVEGKDTRTWYRCEHVRYCSNLLPACPACQVSLPRAEKDSTTAVCGCGASYPSCPECEDGWLVDRSGRYGKFLGCVRFPECSGKGPKSPRNARAAEAGDGVAARQP